MNTLHLSNSMYVFMLFRVRAIYRFANTFFLQGYEDGWHFVYHLKLDRNNPSEVSKKEYRSNEI